MANYTNTDAVIAIVRGLLSTITVPKYLQTKPTPRTGDAPVTEYVVINALPINADVMQRCYINVNYHVRDLASGVKDTTKITAGTAAIMAILKEVTESNYLIDFESQETIREEKLGEHYSNMRFSFKYINN